MHFHPQICRSCRTILSLLVLGAPTETEAVQKVASDTTSMYRSMARDRSCVSSVLKVIKRKRSQIRIYVTVGKSLVGINKGDVGVLGLLFHSDLAQAHYEEFRNFNCAFPSLARYLSSYAKCQKLSKSGCLCFEVRSILAPREGGQAALRRFSQHCSGCCI